MKIAKSAVNLQLNKLPSINLLTADSWGAVETLPDSPGIYACICTVSKRSHFKDVSPENRKIVERLGRKILGVAYWDATAGAVNRGNMAQIVLYIGMSGNLRKRWADHHKAPDLSLASYVLNSLFDVTYLKMHYALTRDRDAAAATEKYLIDIWKPPLNGKSPICTVETTKASKRVFTTA